MHLQTYCHKAIFSAFAADGIQFITDRGFSRGSNLPAGRASRNTTLAADRASRNTALAADRASRNTALAADRASRKSFSYYVFVMLVTFKNFTDIIIRLLTPGVTVPYNGIKKIVGV
jgi:hypothetical protein